MHQRELTITRKPEVPVLTSLQETKLKQVSDKSGLSIATLKLIHERQESIKRAKDNITQVIQKEEGAKREAELVKLAEQIKTILNQKQKTTLSLKDMLQALNDNQRGQFRSKGKTPTQSSN